MKRVLIFVFCYLFSSCQFFDKVFKGDTIAKVGNYTLYESQIRDLVPVGSSPEDSAHIVQRYINSWATQKLLLSMAESQLSKEDKDVEDELADYRTSLLVYRYENLFVEQRLDTVITEQECKKYYQDNLQNFISPIMLMKGRLIQISVNSPNFQIVKSLYKKTGSEDIAKLEEVCSNSADKHTDFNNNWIPITDIARELGEDVEFCTDEIQQKSAIEKTKMGEAYLVYSYEIIPAGSEAPYEYVVSRIKEIILSKRKQVLIDNLERNLLEDAISSDKLKIHRDKKDE